VADSCSFAVDVFSSIDRRLTDPFVITLSGGGSVLGLAFDVKKNPADVLRASGR
jgi:hypothetical protein